jgi:hypothetical protein
VNPKREILLYLFLAALVVFFWITTMTTIRCERDSKARVDCLTTTRIAGIPMYKVSHPNIVGVGFGYEGSDASGYSYIELESGDGSSSNASSGSLEALSFQYNLDKTIQKIDDFLNDETRSDVVVHQMHLGYIWVALLIAIGFRLWKLVDPILIRRDNPPSQT